MPHDVIMPALGMAQDSGVLVRWIKQAGEPVAEGDALFEVETDKATMEVEAQAAGFLTNVTASEGQDVPVGQVIALISDTAEGSADAPAAAPAAASSDAPASDVPEGNAVIMPALGMAQDTGLIVSWQKEPGDKIAADDVLFEVETDKSTVEVPAGQNGYLAALLAEAGDDVPVGETVAIISDSAPANPMRRAYAAGAAAPAAPAPAAPAPAPAKAEAAPAPAPAPAKAPAPVVSGGKILASPKARRLAAERGLDLNRLVSEGYPQPYHVKDIDTLAALPPIQAQAVGATVAAAARLTARADADGFTGFASWAASEAGVSDADSLLAGLGAASLRSGSGDLVVAVERFGQSRHYVNADLPRLGAASAAEEEIHADLIIRDIRGSRITSVATGAEAAPVLTIGNDGDGLSITLEYGGGQLAPAAAIALISEFAGRMEMPMRHLL
ncbi:MAG: pyruvate dehydrogenase [Marivivens sp.]|nr:pyruvate dehydrogenase [Marivivens sp.]